MPRIRALLVLLILLPLFNGSQRWPAAEAEDPVAPAKPQAAQKAKPKFTNRLAKETSPYLLMHAHNPVDWYPWGAEALAKAAAEKKPIFLSIGYSSCYWCHVMERESFLDEEIAKYLNDHFVCVKVDREERPDIDHIYMTAVQIATGRGGWPLSAFLTPDGKPITGGTYFPARDNDRVGQMGFLTLIKRVHDFWTNRRDAVENAATQLSAIVRKQLEAKQPVADVELKAELVDGVVTSMLGQFDPEHGGFGFSATNSRRPKFPNTPMLSFLADRLARNEQDTQARKMLLLTLDKMQQGGIWDHLGGGFHRYSVDRFWHIPHFEKMLYDNGQLASLYTRAFKLTGNQSYRRTAIALCNFVIREMQDAQGGFYAAIDAESEKVEGKFYRWEKKELQSILTDEEFKRFAAVYGIDGEPNFEEHYYVPQLAKPLSEIAKELTMDAADLEGELAPLRAKLLAVRNRRPRPLTDTKILTAWNGLMIRGMADAGRILKEPRYTQAAVKAATHVLDKLRKQDGRLLRTYRDGVAKHNGYLVDYAYLIDGLLALAEATGQEHWIQEAARLQQVQNKLFWDENGGGFHYTSSDHEKLIARAKRPTDGVIPSGNAIAAQNLIRLAQRLNKPEYRKMARSTIASAAVHLQHPRRAAYVSQTAAALAMLLQAEP